MPSVIQKKSYGSVTVFWLDAERVIQNIRNAVTILVSSRDEVMKVYLFGSLAEERAVPGSDVDILIIIDESTVPYHERSDDYIDYFSDIGLGFDLFVYTQEQAENNTIPLINYATENGIILYIKRNPQI